MENRKFFSYVAVIIIVLFSCNKTNLNQAPIGTLDETTLANKDGVEGLLIGAYALLDGTGGNIGYYASGPSDWLFGSVCGSEAYMGSVVDDQPPMRDVEKFSADANNPHFDIKWTVIYSGVARTNEVLRVMRMAKGMTTEDTIEVRCEALFLRAFFHFEAKKFWNDIPFIDESITYDAGNYYVNNDTSWTFIENDLKYAMANLPASQAPAVGRANKYAAEALLAKAYMFEHKYAEAKPLLEDLIENGETAGGIKYQLELNYGDNFNIEHKNGSESVFAVQSSVNDGAGGGNANPPDQLNNPNGGVWGCCGFFQPSQYLVNHFKTDSLTGLPDLDNFNVEDVKSDEGLQSAQLFTPYTGTLDPRLDWTVGRRGIPYLDWGPHPGQAWIRDQALSGPYAPKKNAYYQSQQAQYTDPGFWYPPLVSANNINLIRFSDIILWAAEVEVEIGDLNIARGYVNMIRARAANPGGWVKNDDNVPYAKKVTNSQAEFDTINDPSFTDIKQYDWVVRKDLNQTWVAIKVNNDGTKVWNPYPPPNYKIGLYAVPWTDREYARKAVRFERVLELAMEGQRFFDLQRYSIDPSANGANNGYMADVINAYLQKEQKSRTYLNGSVFKKGINEYFPIPQHQIDLSTDANGVAHLHQNPGY